MVNIDARKYTGRQFFGARMPSPPLKKAKVAINNPLLTERSV